MMWQQVAHVAYHPFENQDIPPDIWCPLQSDNGGMQQGGQDPAMYSQIMGVCEVALTQGNWLWRIHIIMNYMSTVSDKSHDEILYSFWV